VKPETEPDQHHLAGLCVGRVVVAIGDNHAIYSSWRTGALGTNHGPVDLPSGFFHVGFLLKLPRVSFVGEKFCPGLLAASTPRGLHSRMGWGAGTCGQRGEFPFIVFAI